MSELLTAFLHVFDDLFYLSLSSTDVEGGTW